MEIYNDVYFMKKALDQAKIAIESREVPVGAVIVSNDQIIAKAYNQTELLIDVTAHAEILAMTAAMNTLGSKYLPNCTMYVTLEPCVMCAGAMKWAQIGRLVYGAADEKNGFMCYGKDILHPKTIVEFGLLQDECTFILRNFFSQIR